MSIVENYEALLLALKNAGLGAVTTNNPFQSIEGVITVPGQAGITLEAYNELIAKGSINTGSGVYNAIKSASGNVLGYTYTDNYGAISYGQDLFGQLNSNLETGSSAASNVFSTSYGTDIVPVSGGNNLITMPGGMTKYNNGVASNNIKSVFGSIGQATLAAGVGIKMGKALSGGIYNIGTAFGQDWWEYNPETWSSITKGDDSIGAKLFNIVFGLDGSGNVQSYVDINAYGYMAQLMNQYQWFASTNDTIPSYNPQSSAWELSKPDIYRYPISASQEKTFTTSRYRLSNNTLEYTYTYTVTCDGPTYAYFFMDGNGLYIEAPLVVSRYPVTVQYVRQYYYSDGQPGGVTTGGFNQQTSTIDGVTYYASGSKSVQSNTYTYQVPFVSSVLNTTNAYNDVKYPDLMKLTFNGDMVPGGSPIEGIEDNGGQTPNTTGWDFDHLDDVVASLKQQYPDLWDNRISNTVTQPDGTQKTYDYVPFIMPNGLTSGNIDTSTNSPTQTYYNPDNSTLTQLQTLIEMLTNPETSTLSNPDTATQTGTNDTNPTAPYNPSDTGSGQGSPDVSPTGEASSLWAIYNPTQAQLDSFGSWLWSSNFVDQLKKLFNDPMQAIIGVHKVYATPPTSGNANIVCGYLDSGVSAAKVSAQYTTINCGTVNLGEYFGNVFDYDPYTKISVYLPFIGVVPLKTSEVMRSTVNITYGVDVITGACLAKVKITRDGAGAILYSFGGSCACHYPISSGSYSGIISGVLTAATGIAASVATGNPLAAAAGVVSGASHMRATVQHSGGFTGCAGAMGPKIPYIIIERPQTKMAAGYEDFEGVPQNEIVSVGSCSGYARFSEVHISSSRAYDAELSEIETLLKNGVLI